MDAIITPLIASFSLSTFWAGIVSLVPFLIFIIPISLALGILETLVNGISKGKLMIK